MTVQNYADGVGFTSGTTTSLTTSSAAGSEDNVVVTFDGVTQHHNTYTVASTTVTFDAAIPLGVANVEIRFGAILAINTPADNTVTTAKIVDNAVTLAKMAGGTDGELITYDAAGDPAKVPVGTATHVLTSNGAGAAPTMQVIPTQVAQATQSAIEAETNENTYVPPDLIKNSPGVCKSWLQVNMSGTQAIVASHNVTSITDGGVGITQVTIAVDHSSTSYCVGMMSNQSGLRHVGIASATQYNISQKNGAGSLVDATGVFAMSWGDQ
jgi:hypothetical protein